MNAQLQDVAAAALQMGATLARCTVWPATRGHSPRRMFETEGDLLAYYAGLDAYAWGRETPSAEGPKRLGWFDALADDEHRLFARDEAARDAADAEWERDE